MALMGLHAGSRYRMRAEYAGGFCIKNGREAMNRVNCTDKGWYGYAK